MLDIACKRLDLRRLLFICPVVFAVTLSAQERPRPNTWSARTSSGQTLMGTWTAVPDPATGAATGTWTLIDPGGKALARGGWSAAKSPAGWTGAWRASVPGSRAEYSGTWSASVDLAKDAKFADLFERAIETVVSGAWRAGGRSGTWSIRAYN